MSTMISKNEPLRRTLLVLVFLSLAAAARAETISLDTLITNNGEITSGDKSFDQFSYTATPKLPASDAVNITTIMSGSGDFGIRVQGGFADSPGPGQETAELNFRVRPTDANMGITGLTLGSNSAVVSDATVTTTALLSNGTSVVTFDSNAGTELLSSATFGITQSLDINVKIDIETTGIPSAGMLSFVDLTFQQAQVPEPSGLALFAFALPAFGLLRLRLR